MRKEQYIKPTTDVIIMESAFLMAASGSEISLYYNDYSEKYGNVEENIHSMSSPENGDPGNGLLD